MQRPIFLGIRGFSCVQELAERHQLLVLLKEALYVIPVCEIASRHVPRICVIKWLRDDHAPPTCLCSTQRWTGIAPNGNSYGSTDFGLQQLFSLRKEWYVP